MERVAPIYPVGKDWKSEDFGLSPTFFTFTSAEIFDVSDTNGLPAFALELST